MGVGIFVLAWLAAGTGVPPQNDSPAYEGAGRRDPFVNSSGPSLRCAGRTRCSPGLPGFAAAEIALKGTVASKGEYLALLTGPDGKMYTARAGQPLYDARIVSISQGRATLQMVPNAKDGSETTRSSPRVVELTLAH